ncbi:hypothetical protein [Furfurilactobacillus curtus]|uniref:Uncharacterized protein n=1 Tax=Furfurilactobacillus curtus TaxID=1746200 RepID=A0ABQ5JKZ2_9LACO
MADLAEQLVTAKKRQSLVAIYNFVDPEAFSVGTILETDATHVLLKVIDPNGSINGIQLINRDFIGEVKLTSDYLRSTAVWQQAAQTGGYGDPWHLGDQLSGLSLPTEDLLCLILRQALQTQQVINIGTIQQLDDEQLVDTDFTGVISDFVGDTVVLDYLDPWDLSDKWQLQIQLSEINSLRLGAAVCVRMAALRAQYL